MRKFIDIFNSSILAGIAISIGCVVNLKVGGVAGAALFAFGLLTVVFYGFKLYTGTAGFCSSWRDFWNLWLILLGNIAGCLAFSILIRYAAPALSQTAGGFLEGRLALGWAKCGLMGIGCGFIMSAAVQFARGGIQQSKSAAYFLPLLFGIPVFILCGFFHSIADAFYYCLSPIALLSDNAPQVLAVYGSIVAGNFVGCNLYRITGMRNK